MVLTESTLKKIIREAIEEMMDPVNIKKELYKGLKEIAEKYSAKIEFDFRDGVKSYEALHSACIYSKSFCEKNEKFYNDEAYESAYKDTLNLLNKYGINGENDCEMFQVEKAGGIEIFIADALGECDNG